VKTDQLRVIFNDFIPSDLEMGVLYVSMEYATTSHLCPCGCGVRVVTPLGASDWLLTFDGRVTLSPSVGNGQHPCGSHYLVRENEIVWLRSMSRRAAEATHEIDTGRRTQTYNAPVRRGMWDRIGGCYRKFTSRQ
jgi:hypothetical protein